MMNFDVDVDLKGVIERINKKLEMGQETIDTEVIKGGNYFAPEDRSNLIQSAIRSSKIGSGQVVWDTPYAKKLYYNPQYNFSKDKNPNAQGLWFEAGKARFLNDWIQAVQEKVDET